MNQSRADYEMILAALLNCDPEYEGKTAAMEAFMRIGKEAPAFVEEPPPESERPFREQLEALINSASKESGSNTPDFILAQMLDEVLGVFDRAVVRREQWYGREPEAAPAPDTGECQLQFHVDPTFSGTEPSGTRGAPFTNISAAIAAAGQTPSLIITPPDPTLESAPYPSRGEPL